MTDPGATLEVMELMQGLVKGMVSEPREVRVSAVETDGCLVLRISVAEGDLGKVIGKRGRTATSLRTILGATSMRRGIRCELNIAGYEREAANGKQSE